MFDVKHGQELPDALHDPQPGERQSMTNNEQEPLSIDKPEDEPVYSPVCCKCANLVSVRDRRCRAFPNEIPYVIWSGDNPHTSPFAGDNGVLFLYGRTT
ncbi:MAG: hypothetical protein ABL888_13250 [Pirellulaceae bacterium]